MARKSRSYNRRGFQAIPFTAAFQLSTLADNTVLSADLLGGNFVEDFYCISVDATVALNDITAGEVPIDFGYAHGDLTVAEILEALDAQILDPSDIIARERSRRPVRLVGKFSDGTKTEMVLNEGMTIRSKLKFMVNDGKSIVFFVVNRSGSNPLTTGQRLEISGTLYGRWAH